jgi:hypothetical protein
LAGSAVEVAMVLAAGSGASIGFLSDDCEELLNSTGFESEA